MLPAIAQAGISEQAIAFMDNVIELIINPLIVFLIVLGLVVFFIGMIRFLAQSDKSSEDAIKGKKHMLWGILGMFIMVSVFGIMQLLTNSLGAKEDLPQNVQDQIYR